MNSQAPRPSKSPLRTAVATLLLLGLFTLSSAVVLVTPASGSGQLHPVSIQGRDSALTSAAPSPSTPASPSSCTVPCLLTNVTVGLGPEGAVPDPNTGNIYVADSSGSVSVISGVSVIATIPTGRSTDALAFDSANGDIYATNSGSNNVSVISTSTNTVIQSVSVGTGPDGITYDSGLGELFVSDSNCPASPCGTGSVTIISDTSNAVVTTLTVGSDPHGLAYDSANGDVYVANYGSDNVSVIFGLTEKVVSSVNVGSGPDGTAYDPATGQIFITNSLGDNVSVIYGGNNTLRTSVALGGTVCSPTGIGYDSATQDLDVAHACHTISSNLTILSGATLDTVALVDVGPGSPGGVAFDPDLGYVYMTEPSGTTVNVIAVGGGTNTLTSVTIAPTSDTLFTADSGTFTASASCGSSMCPAGITYAWSLSNDLANLTEPTQASTKLVTGNVSGTVKLTVAATLQGTTVESAPANITINYPTLTSVAVAVTSTGATTATIGGGGSVEVAATVTCSYVCPADVKVTWTLNYYLGTITPLDSATPEAEFTAGSVGGTTAIFANATLHGMKLQSAPVLITVNVPTPPNTLLEEELAVLAAFLVIDAVMAVFFLQRKKRAAEARAARKKPKPAPAPAAPLTCPGCGAPVEASATFCPKCMTTIDMPGQTSP